MSRDLRIFSRVLCKQKSTEDMMTNWSKTARKLRFQAHATIIMLLLQKTKMKLKQIIGPLISNKAC